MIHLWILCFILVLVVATTTTANVGLQTTKGVIYGRQTEQTIEYLGIQYAKVIRWKPPVDLASEMFPNGSLEATAFGPCCPQLKTDVYLPMQDEQCLYLNIFKPILQANDSLLPVFVWIHGGAHNHGCSSQGLPLIFNGTNIIVHSPSDQPVIIITINYRLGILADMYLEELIDEDAQWPTAGNYMYLDMLSALNWIKKNIEDYGGDPTNVALFGQSAGGLSVVDLGAVKGSANLYRTVISQSGLSSPGSSSSYYNASNALSYSNSVVQRLNCTNEDRARVLSCLRNSSIENLHKAYINRYTRPIIDNHFFPSYPLSAIQNGTYNNVSLVMGNNDYEQPICFQHPHMSYNEAVALIIQAVGQKWAPLVVEYYGLRDCSASQSANASRCCNIARLILTDKIFDCDIRRLFDAFYFKYGPEYESKKLFSYHLNCYPECPRVAYEGICRHSSELPFVFGTVSDADSQHLFNCTWNNQSRVFSNGIISHWINIAATGQPLSQWPMYDPSAPKYFQITPDQSFFPVTWNRNCSFFDEIEAESVREQFENLNTIIRGIHK